MKISDKDLLEIYLNLHEKVREILEGPLGNISYILRQFDVRSTPPFEIRDIGKVVGKLDSLKILLHSIEADLTIEIIILEKRIREENKEIDGFHHLIQESKGRKSKDN